MHRSLRLGVVGMLGMSVIAGCTGAGAGAAEPPASVAAGTTPVASSTSATDLVDIGAGLHGPAGAMATVIATGLVDVAAFAIDDDDRLWAGTAAYTDDGNDVVALIDPDQAGVAPRTVISGLHTVLGLVWSADTLYVASAGRVDAYAPFGGTTFASHRTVIAFPAGTGEVNGLALGRTDGSASGSRRRATTAQSPTPGLGPSCPSAPTARTRASRQAGSGLRSGWPACRGRTTCS